MIHTNLYMVFQGMFVFPKAKCVFVRSMECLNGAAHILQKKPCCSWKVSWDNPKDSICGQRESSRQPFHCVHSIARNFAEPFANFLCSTARVWRTAAHPAALSTSAPAKEQLDTPLPISDNAVCTHATCLSVNSSSPGKLVNSATALHQAAGTGSSRRGDGEKTFLPIRVPWQGQKCLF